MFIHIGEDFPMLVNDIIYIFNCSNIPKNKEGMKLLEEARKSSNCVDLSRGKPTTLVVTDTGKYISRISSNTILKRSRQRINDEKLMIFKTLR